MSYYLFGSNPAIASYPMTAGSFDTEAEAQECKQKCKDAGWTGLTIEEMEWI